MGAINFKTSDYITMGIEPYNTSDILKDADFIEFANEEYPETDPEEVAQWEIENYYESDTENFNSIFSKYNFYYFHVVLEPGYYESMYIDIEANFPIFYDDYTEKKEALKEATEIKNFLTECAGIGFTACAPGWITTYYNYNETIEKIKEAVQEMKESIKATPTYRQWNRETA